MVRFTRILPVILVFVSSCGALAEERHSENQGGGGLYIQCGEGKVRITVKRQFFRERRIPFKPEFLRLGVNSVKNNACGPDGPLSETEMVISTKLKGCGFKSRIHGKWLVYSSQLLLFPAVLVTSTGSVIVRGGTTVIPVECYYERKQTVKGEPLSPTWVPMTSTVSALGFLRLSLQIMTDGCTSRRSSSVFQQGAAVFLEARVEAPLHPPFTLYVDSCVATLKPDAVSVPSYNFITNHGCLVDSLLPGSSSRFLPRSQDDRLCFSLRTFRFNQTSEEQMFISCHLRAALKQRSNSSYNKACFFHRPSFSWRATEGDGAQCECCDSDCLTEENIRTPDPEEEIYKGKKTVGPLYTLRRSYWTGQLSVS